MLSLSIRTGAISFNLKRNPLSSLYPPVGSPVSHCPLQIIFLKDKSHSLTALSHPFCQSCAYRLTKMVHTKVVQDLQIAKSDILTYLVLFMVKLTYLSWLGMKASGLLQRSLGNGGQMCRHCHIALRTCSADPESLPEAFVGRRKGETPLGTYAFGHCVQR